MEFEFDPGKSESNRRKHGIDFVEAQELWDDEAHCLLAARTGDEPRFAIIARWRGSHWTGIFTIRGKRLRIISVRRARDEEKDIYNQGQ